MLINVPKKPCLQNRPSMSLEFPNKRPYLNLCLVPHMPPFSWLLCLGDSLLQVLYVVFKNTSPMTMNIFVSFVAYLQNMFITCLKDQPTSCNKAHNTTKNKVVTRVFKLNPSSFNICYHLLCKLNFARRGFTNSTKVAQGHNVGCFKKPKSGIYWHPNIINKIDN